MPSRTAAFAVRFAFVFAFSQSDEWSSLRARKTARALV